MIGSHKLLQLKNPETLDPTEGSVRYGYREITGEVPSTGEPVTLRAWAIVFVDRESSASQYRHIVDSLGRVDGSGRAAVNLADISADRFGNMSERLDQLGELTTIWITSNTDHDEGVHGAVLLAFNGILLQFMAIGPYKAEAYDRPVYILERIAMSMSDREAELDLPPENDTLSRLPFLYDVTGALDNVAIGINRYLSPR